MPTGVATKTESPTIIKLPTMALRKPPPSVPGAGVSLVSMFRSSAANPLENSTTKIHISTVNPKPMAKKLKPRFNLNWIYIAVFVGLLGLQLFSSMTPSTLPTTFQAFSKMVLRGDVEKLKVVNKEEIYVYLRKEALEKNEAYKKIAKKSYGDQLNPGPHYQFEMPVESFEAQLERFYAANGTWLTKNGELQVEYETQSNVLGEVLSWILPLVLFGVLWFFLLRRMGGGGGGGGGQIFNIGKSRAQVFEGDSKVQVTFKDVAGMEGAKDEVLEVVDFLKNPKKYTELGGKIPKGVLLSGPQEPVKRCWPKPLPAKPRCPSFP